MKLTVKLNKMVQFKVHVYYHLFPPANVKGETWELSEGWI